MGLASGCWMFVGYMGGSVPEQLRDLFSKQVRGELSDSSLFFWNRYEQNPKAPQVAIIFAQFLTLMNSSWQRKWLVYQALTESTIQTVVGAELTFCFKAVCISRPAINSTLKITFQTNFFVITLCFRFSRLSGRRLSGVYRIYAVGKGINEVF